jgi:hypothetical protein
LHTNYAFNANRHYNILFIEDYGKKAHIKAVSQRRELKILIIVKAPRAIEEKR